MLVTNNSDTSGVTALPSKTLEKQQSHIVQGHNYTTNPETNRAFSQGFQ